MYFFDFFISILVTVFFSFAAIENKSKINRIPIDRNRAFKEREKKGL